MHMSDALLTPSVAMTLNAASLGVGAYCLHRVRQEDNENIPVMGVMGAFVFAAQMINFTIPGTGSSGHLCGGMLLTSILGPEAGFLTMIAVLTVQCLLFADGGLLALGANVWNMAFYGCFIGALLWKFFVSKNPSKSKIMIASIIGSIVSLQLGAFSLSLEVLLSNISELPFMTFLSFMLPIHLAIGLVEGLITGTVLVFIYSTRSEILWGIDKNHESYSLKKVLTVLSICAIMIGGGLSLFASTHPDGLEWSILNITGDTELETNNKLQEQAQSIQDTTSLLPDYSLKDNDSFLGTSLSGIIGGLVVVLVSTGVAFIVKKTRKQTS